MTRTVIVHDYLTQRGGAERVVLSMLKAFPDARLVTSIYEPTQTFPEFANYEIETLWPDRLPLFHADHRLALPVLARAFTQHVIDDADVVLCSSSGWAHGVQTSARKIVYCYTPARWLYQPEEYLRHTSPVRWAGLRLLRHQLLDWDKRRAATAKTYLTLSRVVADRIHDAYGIDAQIVPPPHGVRPDGPELAVEGIEPGYLLTVARLLPYKNVDVLCAAMRRSKDERLVVVGRGPDEERLRALAPRNVTFLGTVSDEQLRWLYRNCEATVSASIEDYGLTPLEANAFGHPALCLRSGGFLDTVVDGVTGLFFDSPTPEDVERAVLELRTSTFDADKLTAHAAGYAEDRFIEALQEIVLGAEERLVAEVGAS